MKRGCVALCYALQLECAFRLSVSAGACCPAAQHALPSADDPNGKADCCSAPSTLRISIDRLRGLQ